MVMLHFQCSITPSLQYSVSVKFSSNPYFSLKTIITEDFLLNLLSSVLLRCVVPLNCCDVSGERAADVFRMS